VERLVQGSVDKIDLVLAIDNSRSMADKQASSRSPCRISSTRS